MQQISNKRTSQAQAQTSPLRLALVGGNKQQERAYLAQGSLVIAKH